ncbi:MAG: reverse transcriptase domain-containing protein [Bacteroidota bacterium]
MQPPDVQAQVQRLLDLGAIYEVEQQPCFLSRIFVVPKVPSGWRLILDVSALNEFIVIPSFKMSNHYSLKQALAPPAWLSSLDLKDAYLHVPIRQNLHKFLALSCWGKLFFFRALPFGLATAPWLFTMLMESVLNSLRKEGLNILGYIDDLVLWNPCSSELRLQTSRTIEVLRNLGLTVNLEKSCPSPVSSLSWLGIVWDGRVGTWCPNPSLLERISSRSLKLSTAPLSTRRQWEALCGLVAFAAQVNRRARHYMHQTTQLTLFDHAVDRDQRVKIHPLLLSSLKPWLRVKDWLRPESFFIPQRTVQCWTDASLGGWGVLSDQGQSWSGRWTEQQSSLHINVLELLTILMAVRLLDVRDTRLVLWCDNQTAISVIHKAGSKSLDLHALALDLLEECENRLLVLFPRHIRGAVNVAADALSREEVLPAEWEVPGKSFNHLQECHYATLQIDLFASPLNNKLPLYYCPFPFPQALAEDALAQDWNQFSQIYLFPPPNLYKEVACCLLRYKGGGVLILESDPTSLRLFPRRFLLKEIPLEQPEQVVLGRRVKATERSLLFRAWSF